MSPADNQATPHVWAKAPDVIICLSPCVMATPDQAASLFDEGWAVAKPRNGSISLANPMRGWWPSSPTAFIVLGAGTNTSSSRFTAWTCASPASLSRDTGKVTTYTIEGEDTKTGEKIKLFTGISPELYQEVVNAHDKYKEVIVEVEALAIKSLAHGNPTLKCVRYHKMDLKEAALSID